MTMKSSTILRIALAIYVAVLAPSHSFAQSNDPQRDALIEERFKAANKKGDGKLTLEEAKAGMPRIAANFDRIDTEKRGYVTLEQIKKLAASR
jgi:hypothetical protein